MLVFSDINGQQVYKRRVKSQLNAVLDVLAPPYKSRIEQIGVESTFN